MNEKQTSRGVDDTGLKLVRPTKKQKELLGFIESFIAEHGYSPSYREIMHGLQYNSVATVALHVGNLIKRGHIIKRERSARSLEIVDPNSPKTELHEKADVTRSSGEEWLVKKITMFCEDVAKSPTPSQMQLDNIAVLLAAVNVLGLDEKVSSVREYFEELQNRSLVLSKN